jgi:hypothetical protein
MTRRLAGAVIALVLCALTGTPSDARQSKNDSYSQRLYDQHSIGAPVYAPQFQQRLHPGPGKYQKRKVSKRKIGPSARSRSLTAAARVASMTGDRRAAQILPHPPGCPPRAFCGCGAALDVFGKHVRSLWLARNWFQFPRAAPAPGMVAVRKHHVFVIREVRGGNMVLAYDANSGGRKTRLHLRSLRGYAVVNPRGSRYARAG